MNKSIEKNIQRIRRFSLTCTLNDNGHMRHFHNGHEYVEIGGIKWAVCNVGAEKPTDSGLYFAWGDTQGFTAEQVRSGEKGFDWYDYKFGHYNNLTKYNNTDKKTVLELRDDATTFNMGIGWKTPTRKEFKVLMDSITSKWVTNYKDSRVNGRLFTDKKDSSKQLFFPAVGLCSNGGVYDIRSLGYYWSSSLEAYYLEDSFFMYFGVGCVCWGTSSRYNGFAMRGIVAE